MEPPRILIIDDDLKLCDLLVRLLSKNHYEVFYVCNGIDAIKKLSSDDMDLILLDIMLPGDDGFAVLQKIRSFSQIPVIMLTARGDIRDRISGLENGADDYLPKPFEPDELLARVGAILRRSRNFEKEKNKRYRKIRFANYILDTRNKIVKSGDSDIQLTLLEFRLLEYLLKNTDQVISRDQITEILYGDEFDPDRRSVDILVSRLRKKLGMGGNSEIIQTVHGHGYRFRLQKL